MKTSNFQKYLGGTAVCMNGIMMATKCCDQLTSNYTYFVDSWSNGQKTAQGVMSQGVDYCGPVKTSHKGFYLATLEKLMK